jgi:hypothetical protein
VTKPILCLDFDGVIHSYTSGWKGADIIPDPPVPRTFEFIVTAQESFRVAIFSSRSNQPGGREAMQKWFEDWFREWTSENPDRWPSEGWRQKALDEIEWPTEKPAAFLTIDDRAITFNGKWPDPTLLLHFKPWNKQ